MVLLAFNNQSDAGMTALTALDGTGTEQLKLPGPLLLMFQI